MKRVLLISALILVFAVGTAIAGFGLPGLGGGGAKLKKEVKQLKLSDADKSLKAYEGTDLDPNKKKQTEYIQFGDSDFDTFALSVAKIELVLAFADNVVADINAKLDKVEKQEELDEMKKVAEAALAALKVLAIEAPKLVDASKNIISTIKSKVTSDPLGYGKNAKAMYEVLEHGADVGKKAPETIKNLTNNLIDITKKIAAKAEELKQQAAEAAAGEEGGE